jgi:hypothetical protein
MLFHSERSVPRVGVPTKREAFCGVLLDSDPG